MAKGNVPKRQSANKVSESTNRDSVFVMDEIEIPDLPSEDDQVMLGKEPQDDFSYDVGWSAGFIGIGQAGSRIAQTFHSIGYRRVCVLDGACQDLLDIRPEIARLDLQTSGSGKDIEVGAASVAGKEESIWELLTRSIGSQVDYLFVCASLGGGTGAGACTKVVELARKYMASLGRPSKVGCIVALPMLGEGQRLARNALTTFKHLRALNPSPLIIIDNQRIQELFKVGVSKIYDYCNEQTAKLFHLFNQLSAQRSRFITFDRAELADLLDNGIVIFGASEIRNFDNKADVALEIRTQLERTALARVELNTATKAGCLFLGGESVLDRVPMDFFDGGFDMLGRLLAGDAVVHRGIYKNNSESLRCFTMLSGLAPPEGRLRELMQRAQYPTSRLAEYLGVND